MTITLNIRHRTSVFAFLILFLSAAFPCFSQEDEYVSLQQRLRSNLFLKVDASSTDCFVGEPIVVTYKLYSALESESRVVRNPSFAGFDVRNLGGSDDDIASRETIDGVPFDVHIIRKLQLMPLKPGRFSIGSLVMSHRIKLVDANGNKDPMLDDVKEGYSLNNGYYNLTVASVPISVIVTELPGSKTKPANFNGLVGSFKMNVQVPKTVYEPGETGTLTITFVGYGDFTKIQEPEVDWPDDIEVLPSKTDVNIDSKTTNGYKAFSIPFKTSKTGKYTIPSINFSFFDAATYKYKTITNIPITFHVVKDGMPVSSVEEEEPETTADNHYDTLLIGGGVLVLLLVMFLLIRNSKRKHFPADTAVSTRTQQPIPQAPRPVVSPAIDADALLRPAADTIHHTGNTFYNFLKQALVKYFEQRFALPATLFNRESLKNSMTDNNISAAAQTEVLNLLTEIDMHIYSGGGLDADKTNLLGKARGIFERL